jgi:hypothetical protein
LHSAELYSFTTKKTTTVRKARDMENLHDIFQLPMTEIAFQQYLLLNTELDNLLITRENGVWSYIWGNAFYAVNKAYKALIDHLLTKELN